MAIRNQDLAHRQGQQDTAAATATSHQHGVDDFKGLLSNIADQILDSDRRHSEAMQNVQSRLTNLSKSARDVRSRAPASTAQVLDRIEQGMSKLGARMASAGYDVPPAQTASTPQSSAAEPVALRSAPAARPAASATPSYAPARSAPVPVPDSFELVRSERQPKQPEPWDSETAEALTRVYEALASSNAGRRYSEPEPRPAPRPARVHVSQSAVPAPIQAPAGCADRAWLEQRLSVIAGSVEKILTDTNPDGVIKAFGERFDEFENRLGSALEGVATRSDVDGIKLMEAHINELSQHFDATHSRLEQLDGIESQLQTVVSQLSDERLAQLVPATGGSADPVEIERLVNAAAEMAASQVQRLNPREQDETASELKAALEKFMDERRQGDEHTATMLDMMQQALERVLERIDSLEAVRPMQSQPAAWEQRPSQQYMPEQQSDYGVPSPAASRSPGFGDMGGELNVGAGSAPNQNVAHAGTWYPEDDGSMVAMQPEEAESFSELDVKAPAAQPSMMQPPASEAPAPSAGTEPNGRNLSPIEKIRQDFIADAQRAKLKAAAEAEAKAAAEVETAAKGGKKKKASAKAGGEPAAGNSILGSKSRVVLVGSLLAIVAVMGALLMMPGKHKKRAPAQPVTIEQPLIPGDSAPTAPTQATPQSDAAPTIESPPADKPAATEKPASGEDLGFEPEAGAPEGAQQNLFLVPSPDGGPAVENMSMTNPVQAPLSVNLISLDAGAASASGPPSAPAALRLNAQSTAPDTEQQAGMTSAALEMPPITVGPHSLRLAAAKGDPSAEFEVAARLAEGKGIQQDFKESIRWFQRSAARGFAQSQYRLASLYERGLGTRTDLERARVWYQRAAEQGHVKAMHNLAVLSAGREAATLDYSIAARWFKMAADYGLADSQYNLAVLTESGLGVTKDLKEAYKWFALASRSGDGEAARRRDAVKAQLSPAELGAAEADIKSFSPMMALPLINDARVAGEDWKKRQVAAQGG